MARLTNTQIAAAFDELGDLYELDGAIVHRVVAYRNAAKAVREAPVSVASLDYVLDRDNPLFARLEAFLRP